MGWFFALAGGLCWGSFLNVAIYRLERGESLVWPRSRCPRCKKLIVWYDNLPVLSFLLLGGRCRRCRAPISRRYPAVELMTGLVTAGLWTRWSGEPAWFAASVLASGSLIVLAFIDLDTFYIPDACSLGLVPLGLAAAWVNPHLQGGLLARLGGSLAGAAAGFGVSYATALAGEWWFGKEALGGGDVKLLAGVGALLTWGGAISTLLIGCFFGAVYGGALLLRGRLKRQDPIPFGPFLSLGALINLFVLITPLDFALWMDALIDRLARLVT